MVWEPYTEFLADAPDYCTAGRDIWMTRSPLIHFHMVELHLPDRVLRQFGRRQQIPQLVDTSIALHGSNGSGGVSWRRRHQQHIADWADRAGRLVWAPEDRTPLTTDDPYMVWYYQITRRFIGPIYMLPPAHGYQPHGGIHHSVVHTLDEIVGVANERLMAHSDESDRRAWARVGGVLRDLQRFFTRRARPGRRQSTASPARPSASTRLSPDADAYDPDDFRDFGDEDVSQMMREIESEIPPGFHHVAEDYVFGGGSSQPGPSQMFETQSPAPSPYRPTLPDHQVYDSSPHHGSQPYYPPPLFDQPGAFLPYQQMEMPPASHTEDTHAQSMWDQFTGAAVPLPSPLPAEQDYVPSHDPDVSRAPITPTARRISQRVRRPTRCATGSHYFPDRGGHH